MTPCRCEDFVADHIERGGYMTDSGTVVVDLHCVACNADWSEERVVTVGDIPFSDPDSRERDTLEWWDRS